MEFAGQSVLVLGLGLSGRSAARFCAERGARVVAIDERDADSIPAAADLPKSIDCRFGEPFPESFDYDVVVPSPGIPADRWAGRARRVWGDIELAYRALPIPIIAVTGTNGKSTVVRLIEAMARASGLRARAAGNVGVPALDLVGEALDLAILEVSSFQLESIDSFRPRTSVLLNITPDHLDRHGDIDGYIAAKARIFERQGKGDSVIVNADDPNLRDLTIPENVERLEFSRRTPVHSGAWRDGQNVIIRRAGAQHVVRLGDGNDARAQLADNVVAALLALATLDVDLQAASEALIDFEGLPHRCQLIARVRGVRYIDDSKATNLGAAIQALESFGGPLLWIVGGRHKGGDFRALIDSATGRVRRAFLIGEAAAELEDALGDTIPCERVADLDKAVERAMSMAQTGDTVLLAPACASFDQFESFEDRGRQFQAAVATYATHPAQEEPQ